MDYRHKYFTKYLPLIMYVIIVVWNNDDELQKIYEGREGTSKQEKK